MFICILYVSASTDTASAQESPARPNIVLIVADDLGWADVSFHGDQISTPHIDRLVREGVELNRFYVCPICSPTRAGLMTGRYPIRFGSMRAVVPPWHTGGMSTGEVTLPQVLAQAGYEHRGIFGKWHLGHGDAAYHPLRRGFSEFIGHYHGWVDYFTHLREGELDWHRGFEPNRDVGYTTDLIAAAAAEFINRHAGDEAPFFCYVPFNAPHDPLQAKPEDLQAYEHLVTDKAESADNDEPPRTGRGRNARQKLAAMISSMDQGVGRILAALDENDLAENTLVWFFSDNGGTNIGDNRPLRGGKATVFEGGIRVAAALRWPAQVSPGRQVTAPLAYIDVLPTLMRVTGIADHGGRPLDGIDGWDLITGEQTSCDREIYSYTGQSGEHAERTALTDSTWKLVINGPRITDDAIDPSRRDVYLFQIADDPYEKTNRASEHPQIVVRMTARLREFRDLQPPDGVPPYRRRPADFKAPKDWQVPGR